MGGGVPALWFNSWCDVAIGPNMALFNHASTVNSDREASANQYVIIGPNPHCRFSQLGKDYKVGDRELGDASFPVDEQIWAFRSEEHTSELQSLMRSSYAVFCCNKKTTIIQDINHISTDQ